MIRSMTGFGRATFEIAGRPFEVEIRTVNHRHLDSRIRLPRLLADQESLVKSLVQGGLSRGKVDVNISAGDGPVAGTALKVDEDLAGHYVGAARALSEAHGLPLELDAATLLSLPGVTRFSEAEMPTDTLVDALRGGVDAALAGVTEMRAAEGAKLAEEFEKRLGTVLELVDFFQARSGEVLEAARERLRKRTEQIRKETGLLDEARLHQEIVIAADRLDVTEELVRLRSHVDQFRVILQQADEGQGVGRRLDFLLQEMGREANTIGSKANDAPIAHNVVELKTELERIREQVQNVE
ncbi:MAG: YicC family protein [Deltaproteobacteria bacterium]|nr:YicC family protein [Deltaproteobacteria bacterium]